ncbi:DUF3649 domain-containing protein [Roseateles sp. DAIF2]|uniref:DUF3649 domain-containing protein n=1 Tax=Roseateles sp. DAIF2 TaxID=2714952 RepID=UPI0018A30388|nr:DUF3649 domain-containing protein [Roseateles sp. DAIF2]QPF73514.1 DUF3649 domain-containing protein [Roseateles sp. DAIF2]
MAAAQKTWRYRAAVGSRALAALLGGYLLAAAVAAACAVYLPLLTPAPRSEATVGGAMLAYLVYALAFMSAFACRSAWRAWAWILGPALALGGAVLLPRWL